MMAHGKCYWYPTRYGLDQIGVVRPGSGLPCIVAWYRGLALRRVKSPALQPTQDPEVLQAKLDAWAKAKKLEEAVPF